MIGRANASISWARRFSMDTCQPLKATERFHGISPWILTVVSLWILFLVLLLLFSKSMGVSQNETVHVQTGIHIICYMYWGIYGEFPPARRCSSAKMAEGLSVVIKRVLSEINKRHFQKGNQHWTVEIMIQESSQGPAGYEGLAALMLLWQLTFFRYFFT